MYVFRSKTTLDSRELVTAISISSVFRRTYSPRQCATIVGLARNCARARAEDKIGNIKSNYIFRKKFDDNFTLRRSRHAVVTVVDLLLIYLYLENVQMIFDTVMSGNKSQISFMSWGGGQRANIPMGVDPSQLL